MAEETAVPETEQETETTDSQDQNQEQNAEGTEQKPEGENTEGTETEQAESTTEEYWDSEEDYNESLGLGKRTNAQIAEYVKSLETKAETYRQTNPTWNPPQQQAPEKSKDNDFKFIPKRGVATQQLSSIQFTNDEAGQKTKAGWETMTKLIDSALDPTFDTLEENMQSLRFAIAQMADHLQRQSYNGVKRKDLVPFEKIEGFMKQNFILDANKAVQRYLVDNNPDLLVQLTKDAEKAGEKRGQNFRFKKNSATRRQKPTTNTGKIYAPYVSKDGDIDRAKLNHFPASKQKEIVDAWYNDITKE